MGKDPSRLGDLPGRVAFVVFTLWASLAYQASAEGEAALESNRGGQRRARRRVLVVPAQGRRGTDGAGCFSPGRSSSRRPMRRSPARWRRRGFRCCSSSSRGAAPSAAETARSCSIGREPPWRARPMSIDGSSPGIPSADGSPSTFARTRDPRIAGLVLVGTSHPRDLSLADVTFPVTRIYGTRDTVADVDKIEATRGNLPPSTRDGGNRRRQPFAVRLLRVSTGRLAGHDLPRDTAAADAFERSWTRSRRSPARRALSPEPRLSTAATSTASCPSPPSAPRPPSRSARRGP